ncbi:MAG: lasso peptide biosynthesis PqqD family chaperone [Actinomycetota bacterium]|nr:lasso peptide biosynthesis PqqD family chaperone [Actinomycetota bacterium]MDQ3900467.1 lasso peptide biosynthesis PqqD family chaperone [Actinomycetota bacterium]
MPLRLRSDIATTDTDDSLVLLDERTGRYWQLNSTGAAVLHALLAGRHPDQIADDLATRYRIDVAQAQHDVTALTTQLQAAKLVQSS